MAGMTTSVRIVDEIMPPIIGTAMRCMTSDPVPVAPHDRQQSGHDGDDRHHLRAHALDRADMMASCRSSRVNGRPSASRCALDLLQRVIEIDQHHDAGLGGDAGQRDEAHGDGDRQVEAEPPHEPQPADQREGQRQHDDERFGQPAEVEIEQQEDDQQRDRHDDLQPRLGPLQIFELAAPGQRSSRAGTCTCSATAF